MTDLMLMLDNHPAWMSPHFINIYLVYKGARDICVVDDIEGDPTSLYQYAINLDLEWYEDVPNNWLVARRSIINEYLRRSANENPSSVLGELLGFRGYDQQWSNPYRDRLTARTTIRIGNYMPLEITFVMEKDRTDLEELQQFLQFRRQTIMDVLPAGTDINIQIMEVPALTWRVAALIYHDTDYIASHLDDYRNDVYNYVPDQAQKKINMLIMAASEGNVKTEEWDRLVKIWMNMN